jgi:putative colanic acid biosynthesis UDP-glucose lipid carrier transferase
VGVLSELKGYAESAQVDEVWVVVPLREEAILRDTFRALHHSTANVRYAPDLYGYELLNHAVTEIGGVTMMDMSVSPMEGVNRLVKRTEDLVLGSVFLLLATPLMLVIALGVKLDSPGPVLFKQRRIGWSGREFVIFKFRTMQLHQQEDRAQLPQATRDDPRVTRVGRLLRRTSLDELPQLINVLQGRMSLVGPRPHAVEHHYLYIDQVPSYAARHMVKPGITGFAQVSGYRGETDTPEKMQRRVEYDVLYIQHWSLMLDLKILALTLLRGFTHKNAY